MQPQNATEEQIVASGGDLEEVAYEDYFGFEERHKWFFPDGKQFIEFKILTEGDRAKYQRETSRDITLRRSTGDASLKVDPGEERRILIESSVTDWFVIRQGQEMKFTSGGGGTFMSWYRKANPKLVDDLVEAIREKNPWLVTENMTVEEIDREIDRLKERRTQVEKLKMGKADS